MAKGRSKAAFMISAVAEQYQIWEREKLYGEMYALQWLQSQHRQP